MHPLLARRWCTHFGPGNGSGALATAARICAVRPDAVACFPHHRALFPLTPRRFKTVSKGIGFFRRHKASRKPRLNEIAQYYARQLVKIYEGKEKMYYIPDSGIPRAEAIVLGAGPAGIAAVANLLEVMDELEGNIVWVDPLFDCGSIRMYRDVQSYSTVEDFLSYAHRNRILRSILQSVPPSENPVERLQMLPRQGTCKLGMVYDMLKLFTEGLRKHKRVESITGTVTFATRDSISHAWSVSIRPDEIGFDVQPILRESHAIAFCTGCHPRTENLRLKSSSRIPLETALSKNGLIQALRRVNKPPTVAVVGDGHCAVYVLKNLFELATSTHPGLRVRWITRTPHLKYVEKRDGITYNKNTGLKGEIASFARSQLEGDVLRTSEAGKFIERIIVPVSRHAQMAAELTRPDNGYLVDDGVVPLVEEDRMKPVYQKELHGVDFVIQAIGFVRNKLPELRLPVEAGLNNVPYVSNPKHLMFDSVTGTIFHGERDSREKSAPIGLYGAGSAFPELERTSPGLPREPAVSMAKFMKYLECNAPEWIFELRQAERWHHRMRERKVWKAVARGWYKQDSRERRILQRMHEGEILRKELGEPKWYTEWKASRRSRLTPRQLRMLQIRQSKLDVWYRRQRWYSYRDIDWRRRTRWAAEYALRPGYTKFYRQAEPVEVIKSKQMTPEMLKRRRERWARKRLRWKQLRRLKTLEAKKRKEEDERRSLRELFILQDEQEQKAKETAQQVGQQANNTA